MEASMRVAYVPFSREMLDDALPPFEEIVRMAEEQARILAERKAAYEAERCPTCGHHPDDDC